MSEAALARARGRRLDADVRSAGVLVCTGAGGVGKTTVAAALALAAARRGRRTLVLTIDPARRLAQSLGIDTLDNVPRRIDDWRTLEAQTDDGDARDRGELWGMMLDMQRTFDEIVDEHAGSRSRAAAIKSNRIYQTLSSTLSGTQEYMAMEKLHALQRTGRWELLVVDTPPTRNALDFLDAPRRMTDFLEGRLLRALLKPGMVAGKGLTRVVGFGTQAFMRIAGRVTGMELLEDLADFFHAFEGMYDGFKRRAEEVRALLAEPTSRFVVVASPQPPPLREARFFLERLQKEGLHTAGVVINRVHPDCDDCPSEAELRSAARDQPDEVAGRATAGVLRLLADTRNMAVRERRAVAAALYGLSPPALVEVPLLRTDVHDLPTLAEVAQTLTDSADGPPATR